MCFSVGETYEPSLLQGTNQKPLASSAPIDITEEAAAVCVLCTPQGIDGKHVRYSRRADGFVVDAAVGVPRATRHLCHTLAELGWLFRRVRHFVSEGLDNLQLGRVAQGLCASLQVSHP